MIKRVTKVTSLLMVAASIVSMVPVIAADYEKINAEEGTINKALSKGNGKFIIDGEINGDDDEAMYYLKDGKYTKLDNASAGDTINDIISDKYLQLDDGDYYIDLTTGEYIDEDIKGNLADDKSSVLRKKIKNDNDGRFSEDNYTGNVVSADGDIAGVTGIWTQFSYILESENLIGNDYSTIYCDDKGNYVDADYNLGKIPVYITTGSSVTIKNTEDTYEIEEDGNAYEIKAQVEVNSTIVECINDITRTAKLSIWKKVKNASDDTYENITSEVQFGSSGNHHAIDIDTDSNYGDYVTVFQNISKEQSSDNIDGIKYSKDVKTYFLTDEDGNAKTLLGLGNTGKSGTPMLMGIGDSKGVESYVIDSTNKKIYVEAVNFKSKNGYNYIDVGDSDETNYDAWSFGGGDFYCLDAGYIKWWNNDDAFEKMYKVDGGMSNLSISDKNNIIVWNEDDGIYSIIVPKASSEEQKYLTTNINTSTTTGTAVTTTDWVKNSDGTWSYVNVNGTKATGWINDGASWYYLKLDGIMTTGWINENGEWYYLKATGAMSTGWVNDNRTWYYFNTSGAMLANTTVDGYVLGANGAWIK